MYRRKTSTLEPHIRFKSYLKVREQFGQLNSAIPHILSAGTGSYFFLHRWQRDTFNKPWAHRRMHFTNCDMFELWLGTFKVWSDILPFSSEAHAATSPCHMTHRQTDVRQKGSGSPAPGQTFVCSPLLRAEPVDAPRAPASMSVHVSSHLQLFNWFNSYNL